MTKITFLDEETEKRGHSVSPKSELYSSNIRKKEKGTDGAVIAIIRFCYLLIIVFTVLRVRNNPGSEKKVTQYSTSLVNIVQRFFSPQNLVFRRPV